MKYFLSLMSVLFLPFAMMAGEKEFTLNDVISGGDNYLNFLPETLHQLQWLVNSDRYSYVEQNELIVSRAEKEKNDVLLSLADLQKILSDDLTLTSFPSIKWYSEDEFGFWSTTDEGQLFIVVNPFKEKLSFKIRIPLKAKFRDLHFNARRVAYTITNNLYIATPDISKIAVTFDNNSDIVNGQSVHRREFGIDKGTFWSPDGKFLAFYRKDESMVGSYPLVDITQREAVANMIKYPMAGMKSHVVSIGIYDISTSEITFLNTGKPDERYFTNIYWTEDNSRLFVAEINRAQNHMKMQVYAAESGKLVQTMFEEKHPKYVEPQHALIAIPVKKEAYLWLSRRDGYNHLYLYDAEGELKKQLTKGDWEIIDFLGFSEDGRSCFATSTIKSPLERHVIKIDIKQAKINVLSNKDGTHKAKISSSGKYLIDNWSNFSTPRKIDIVEAREGRVIKHLLTAKDPFINKELGETVVDELKADDGSTALYYRMVKPTHFDPSKKYPVIVYVYGGPHAQLVHNKWMAGARMWQHFMAQKGYIAFTLDNRGSANRGANFENVIHRQLGQVEMRDQMMGINYLKSLSYVDAERIGVHGWSYGGFMTTALMTSYPDVFKVGVAGGPVIDWKYYEIMYGERYMDMPQENSTGYAQANLLNKVKDLKGRLLMIHGAQDPTVVWQHSMAFVEACIKENVQLDYFVYPTHEHNVRGKDRVHLMQKVSTYFDDFLIK